MSAVVVDGAHNGGDGEIKTVRPSSGRQPAAGTAGDHGGLREREETHSAGVAKTHDGEAAGGGGRAPSVGTNGRVAFPSAEAKTLRRHLARKNVAAYVPISKSSRTSSTTPSGQRFPPKMSGKASSYNLSLIAAYRTHPLLYDNRHRDYKVQNPTKDAWADIARICGTPPDECRARWKALRDRYIKERKKRQSNGAYKVAWPLYHKMSFLEPYVENTNKRDIRSPTSFHRSQQSGSASGSSLGGSGVHRGRVAKLPGMDLHRRTIDNVVELLVREAQNGLNPGGAANFAGLLSAAAGASANGANSDVEMNGSGLLGAENSTNSTSSEPFSEDPHELERFYTRLIREVQKHQLLFDPSNPLYRVAAARNRVWEEIAENFDEGYSANELRTKWRSIRDRYIRERRLYKESIQEGQPRLPKWQLYNEFAFLDYYVDQSLPRSFLGASQSAHHSSAREDSAQNDEEGAESINGEDEKLMMVDEPDQSSPSSSSSTPASTIGGIATANISATSLPLGISTGGGVSNAASNLANSAALLQLFQKIMNGNAAAAAAPANNHNELWPSRSIGSTENNNTSFQENHNGLMSTLNASLQRPSSGPKAVTTSFIAEGVTDALKDLRSCCNKLAAISTDISENGLEYSFGHYVANELLRTPEPRRSETRRAILAILTESNNRANKAANSPLAASSASTTPISVTTSNAPAVSVSPVASVSPTVSPNIIVTAPNVAAAV